ncbi:hypothetical protein VZT92_009772 [Zoarces viviparus]|uniref:Uncharacterized protein n=1 Tax=Zoarces viviparus TaxID=48416 RepID=A0AAW1FFN1_ZOAVI
MGLRRLMAVEVRDGEWSGLTVCTPVASLISCSLALFSHGTGVKCQSGALGRTGTVERRVPPRRVADPAGLKSAARNREGREKDGDGV